MDQKPFTREELKSFLQNNTFDEMYKTYRHRFYPDCLIGLPFETAKRQAEDFYGKDSVELLPPGTATYMDYRGIVKLHLELDDKGVITKILE